MAGAFLLAMGSCRSAKKIQTAVSKKDTSHVAPVIDARADSIRFISEVYQGIQKNRIDFRTFSAKVKVEFAGNDGKRTDVNANIRITRDSVIWVSINALLGIEAFRVMITPDSVKLLNKLDKIIQLRSVNYLQEVAKIPLTFYDLQELLIGNPVFLDSNIISYRKDDQTVSLVSVGKLFRNLLTVKSSDYALQQSKLDDIDVLRSRTGNISYGGYELKGGQRFSTSRRITLTEKTKLDIEMQFKQVDFNLDLSFPFAIPRNYKSQ